MRTASKFVMPDQLLRAVDEVDRTLAGGDTDVNLDFVDCKFISVEGVEWLEELVMRSTSLSAKVEFTNVLPSIYKVFKIARMDSLTKACGGMSNSGPVC